MADPSVLAGKPVEPQTDTGTFLLTPENLDSAEAKDLWSPDLNALLKGTP